MLHNLEQTFLERLNRDELELLSNYRELVAERKEWITLLAKTALDMQGKPDNVVSLTKFR